jgi:sec-independent protein translocase protein TatB
MLDFSWAELFVIVIVALVVIGPKDIPHIMHALGRFVRRLQYVRFAMTQQFDDFMREHDLEDIRNAAKPDIIYDEAAADEEDVIAPARPVPKAAEPVPEEKDPS